MSVRTELPMNDILHRVLRQIFDSMRFTKRTVRKNVLGIILHLYPPPSYGWKVLTFITFGCSASEWKVPTTFIYGYNDWMSYQGAQEARKHMKVPCEIIRVPQVSLPLSLSLSVKYEARICRSFKVSYRLCCMIAGWSLCVHRQPNWLPRSCIIWLPQVSLSRPG